MKTWVRKSLNVGVLSAGFLLVSGGAAHADWTTGYNAGLLDGNQLDTKLQVPVDVSGNALGLLGFADAQSGGGAVANTESATTESANSTESWTTGFNGGILNGNQLSNTVQVPVNVCGNSIAVLGFANASCGGGAVANTGGMHAHHGGESAQLEKRHPNGNGGTAGANGWGGAGANSNGGSNWTTGYNAGLLNGNQASNTIQVPIDLCGNAIAVAGFSSASCSGGAWANTESATTESAQTEDWTTGFNAGVANGNQISNTLQVPINVCGNSIAVLGFSSASCGGGAVANTGGMGNGNGNGHHRHHNGGNGDGNGTGNNNGAYDATGNSAYDNSAGATGVSSHKASKHGKKSGEAADEHGTWNDPNGSGNGSGNGNDGYGDVSPAGYSAGANGGYGDSNGSGNGNDNYGGNGNSNGNYGGNGSGNGSGNGNGDNNGGRHHRHHGGWGNGNGDANGGGGAMANAGSCGDWTTGYNAGLLNGNQVSNTLQVPVNISGNAIGILGFANASSQGGAMANAC